MKVGELLGKLWEYILTLILPSQISTVCHRLNSTSPSDKDYDDDGLDVDPPSAADFMQNLEPSQVVFLAVGTPLTLAVIFLALLQWFYIWTYISSEERRNWLYFLISLFPVSTLCCLIGMYSPRSAVLVSSIGLLYFLTCLFILVALIRHLSNGRPSLSHVLEARGKRISFRSPPFCCCMPCLPKAAPSVTNLKRLEWTVLQAPILRMFIVFGQIIAVAEQREHALKLLQIFDMASMASLLLAIFGVHTLARVASDELTHFGFGWIFRVVDLALFFFSAQQPILFQNIFLRFGIIHCGPLLSPHDNARFICNFVIICELFTLSLFSTFLVSPHRNALFDLYWRKHGGENLDAGCRRLLSPSLLTQTTAARFPSVLSQANPTNGRQPLIQVNGIRIDPTMDEGVPGVASSSSASTSLLGDRES